MVVDALLGTGANRPIEGLLAEVLDTLRRNGDEPWPSWRSIAPLGSTATRAR